VNLQVADVEKIGHEVIVEHQTQQGQRRIFFSGSSYRSE
jgi:hypothetical protein